ncbi:MAG: hypothetical protein ABF335_03985 [Alphaproteobacteria bacterium]
MTSLDQKHTPHERATRGKGFGSGLLIGLPIAVVLWAAIITGAVKFAF